MLIVNADDWGRSREETDAALGLVHKGVVSSVTAMTFMEDSSRAAEIACRFKIDTGLHLNFSQPFAASRVEPRLVAAHERICRFLHRGRATTLVYAPWLASDFDYSVRCQLDEFRRLYGEEPSHVDGHHHLHLSANVLLGRVIPSRYSVRPSFHFWPEERSAWNRAYRRLLNAILRTRHPGPDYFFALSQAMSATRLDRILELARHRAVELMTHPVRERERSFLVSEGFRSRLEAVRLCSYAQAFAKPVEAPA